ncbi:MAG: hypothetical protein ACRYE7_01890 [Janthinobacterium lividum]
MFKTIHVYSRINVVKTNQQPTHLSKTIDRGILCQPYITLKL